jgi:hypothetical protein
MSHVQGVTFAWTVGDQSYVVRLVRNDRKPECTGCAPGGKSNHEHDTFLRDFVTPNRQVPYNIYIGSPDSEPDDMLLLDAYSFTKDGLSDREAWERIFSSYSDPCGNLSYSNP